MANLRRNDTHGRLLRRPINELSAMDGTYNAAVTDNNYVLAYGDWRKCVLIADRIGASFDVIPHLFGANGRPDG